MLRRYPETLRWRQALPPVFVLLLLVLLLLSPFLALARWGLVVVFCTYSLILLSAGVHLAIKRKDLFLPISVPLAIAVMHLSWGTGFLWSLVSPPKSE